MTKRQLIDQVARKGHMTKRAAAEAVDVFLDEIGRVLSKGEKVRVGNQKTCMFFGQKKRAFTAL